MSVTYSADVPGVEDYELNLANGNAALFFRVLGLTHLDPYYGELDIPSCRRAVLFARNTNTARHERPGLELPAGPGPRVIVQACDASRIERYLVQFMQLVNAADEAGATVITWS